MTDVEKVRKLCADRGVSIHTLEMACGFSNGYLNPKKAPKRIPYDRAVLICQFLKVPLSTLGYPDSESIISPTEREIRLILDFRELSDANKQTILDNIAFLLEKQAKEKKESASAQ